MLLPEFTAWLSQTHISQYASSQDWIIVVSQSIHIVAVAVVIAPMLMLNLRMLGIPATNQPIATFANRFVPPVWIAFLVLLFTGIVQTIAEPGRELLSNTFWLKMCMVAIVVVITLIVHRTTKSDATYWESRPGLSKAVASFSIVLWIAILVAGRFIAYLEHG